MSMTSWWDKKKKTIALVLALCLSMGTGIANAAADYTFKGSETKIESIDGDDTNVQYTTTAENGTTTSTTTGPRVNAEEKTTAFNADKTTIEDARLVNKGTVEFKGKELTVTESKAESLNALTNEGTATFNNQTTSIQGDVVQQKAGATTTVKSAETAIDGQVWNVSGTMDFQGDIVKTVEKR